MDNHALRVYMAGACPFLLEVENRFFDMEVIENGEEESR